MLQTRLHSTSVTRELDDRDSALRDLLRPHEALLGRWRRSALAQLSGRPWIRPERTSLAWMAAMAFDYRARWWACGVDTLPVAVLAGLRRCRPAVVNEIVGAFSGIHGLSAGGHTSSVEEGIAAVAVAAASVEPLYRAGRVPCAVDEMGLACFLDAHRDVTADVLALTGCLPATLTPRMGSGAVSGPATATGRLAGDADLLVGRFLIEIKAVVDPRRSLTRALQQLLTYAARLRPETAGLLLPRQHVLVEFDLAPYASELHELDTRIRTAYEL